MMFLFEIIRLYLGYVGNLCERVPELTGFWLLTIMVEIPLSTFLLVIAWFPIGITGTYNNLLVYFIPMQFVLEIIHALFAYVEIFLGLFALRVLARYQISRFHYKQFDAYEVNRISANESESDDWLVNLNKENNFPMKVFKVNMIFK
jgi:transmembrane protein 17